MAVVPCSRLWILFAFAPSIFIFCYPGQRDGVMLLSWSRVEMQEDKPNQARRVKTFAYFLLAKASHMAKPIISGVGKFLPPQRGIEETEYLLNNNTVHCREAMEFPSQLAFTNRRDC